MAVIRVSKKVAGRVNGSRRGGGEGISLRVQKVQVFEPEDLKKSLEVVRLELACVSLNSPD